MPLKEPRKNVRVSEIDCQLVGALEESNFCFRWKHDGCSRYIKSMAVCIHSNPKAVVNVQSICQLLTIYCFISNVYPWSLLVKKT